MGHINLPYTLVPYLWHFGFFFSAAPTAQNGPRMKIHIGNVPQALKEQEGLDNMYLSLYFDNIKPIIQLCCVYIF